MTDGADEAHGTDATTETNETRSAPRDLSPAMARLKASLTRLTELIQSGELQQELRKVALANPVPFGTGHLSAGDADVVEVLATFRRPVPRSRLLPRQVAALPRLQRVGLVSVDGVGVVVTPRGRALAMARARERKASRREVGQLRDTLVRFEHMA